MDKYQMQIEIVKLKKEVSFLKDKLDLLLRTLNVKINVRENYVQSINHDRN